MQKKIRSGILENIIIYLDYVRTDRRNFSQGFLIYNIMELQNGMKVIAPATCNAYFTVGKSYEVFEVEPSTKYGAGFEVINDFGEPTTCLLKQCKHLNDYNWVLMSKPSLKEQLLTLTKTLPNDMELGGAVRKLLNNE